MSRNIKTNFKQYNTSFMKTLSKQTTDNQNYAEISSFQTSNNFKNKNTLYKTNIYTYTNNSNTNKRYPNYKIRIKNNSFQKFALINNFNNNSKSKYKNNLYLINNNTLNNDSYSFTKYKKRTKAKTKEKLIKNNYSNITSGIGPILKNKTEYNSLNTSKNTKIKHKKNNNSNKNNYLIKTNINSPLGSDRDEKQIISLNHELMNKNNEIKNLKKRINEQNIYISELEKKIKCIFDDKVKQDVDYEQYSKKMIVRNIKVLIEEKEELHKQINEYKEKEMKIMKALYYLNKQGISIDDFLQNINGKIIFK